MSPEEKQRFDLLMGLRKELKMKAHEIDKILKDKRAAEVKADIYRRALRLYVEVCPCADPMCERCLSTSALIKTSP